MHFLVLRLAPPYGIAQVDRAGLSGTVRNSAGACLPGAHVTTLQFAARLVRESESSANGTYAIPDLPIGLYRVTCSAAGFQQAIVADREQTVGRSRTLDIKLAIGGVTQQVNVPSLTPDDKTATLGSRVEFPQVKDLPLNGRN